MPPKISVKSVGKAGSRKKGEDADAGYKKVSFGSPAKFLFMHLVCLRSLMLLRRVLPLQHRGELSEPTAVSNFVMRMRGMKKLMQR